MTFYADAFERTGRGCGAGKGPQPDAHPDSDVHPATDRQPAARSGEVYPVGMFNDAPASDDPIYYATSRSQDGHTMQVGPFGLTAEQMRDWSHSMTSNDLDDLVSSKQIRPATALTVKSTQFKTILKLLESGQTPSEDMVQRFIPGDLQRVIARSLKSSP